MLRGHEIHSSYIYGVEKGGETTLRIMGDSYSLIREKQNKFLVAWRLTFFIRDKQDYIEKYEYEFFYRYLMGSLHCYTFVLIPSKTKIPKDKHRKFHIPRA